MKIENVIFDFGGVLVDWNPRYLYNSLFEDKNEMEFFLENICNDNWNLQQDAGRTFSEGVAILVEKYPEYQKMIEAYSEKWSVMLKSDIPENVKLIPLLKSNYNLFGLTNWSAEKFPIALKRFSFFQEFDGIVVSGEEKMKKPDDEIFLLLLERYNLKANNSLFIDDNLANINTAKRLGFQTIFLEKNTNLKEELIQLGIGFVK